MDKGVKHDGNKPRMDLISPYALEELAKVLTSGATRYGEHNWRGGLKNSRLLAAALRHINAHQRGETYDNGEGGSQTYHLSNAFACVMMLLENMAIRPELDDRYFKGESK